MGKVGKATAADGTSEAATVVGFANDVALTGETVKVIVVGLKTLSGLDAGDLYFFIIKHSWCNNFNSTK